MDLDSIDYERQIFQKFFMAILFAFTVFARYLLKGSHPRNIFFHNFLLLSDLRFETWPYIYQANNPPTRLHGNNARIKSDPVEYICGQVSIIFNSCRRSLVDSVLAY